MQVRLRFVPVARNPLRRSCASKARNAVQVRARFGFVRRNPLRRSCVSKARNAGESAFWICPAQPSAEIVRVEGAKCCGEIAFWICPAQPCGDRACRGREMQVRLRFGFVRRNPLRVKGAMQVRARFGDLAPHFWRQSRAKRWFWRLGASHLEEVSYKSLVLETWRFPSRGSLERVLETWRLTFGGSLVRNARFGDLALHFWRKPRTKRRDTLTPTWKKEGSGEEGVCLSTCPGQGSFAHKNTHSVCDERSVTGNRYPCLVPCKTANLHKSHKAQSGFLVNFRLNQRPPLVAHPWSPLALPTPALPKHVSR